MTSRRHRLTTPHEDMLIKTLDYLDEMQRSGVRSERVRSAVERAIAALHDLRGRRFGDAYAATAAANTVFAKVARELDRAANISRSREFRDSADAAIFWMGGIS